MGKGGRCGQEKKAVVPAFAHPRSTVLGAAATEGERRQAGSENREKGKKRGGERVRTGKKGKSAAEGG